MALSKTFLKSASVLISGTVLAQAITFLLSFVLARLYSPGDFGRYALFAGVGGVLAACATGAYDRMILLEKSDVGARRVATLTLCTAAVGALMVVVSGSFVYLTGTHQFMPLPIVDVVFFMPMFIVFYAGAQVFSYLCLRHERPNQIATLKVGQSAVMGSVQFLATGMPTVSGLILGQVAGWAVLFVAGIRSRAKLGFLADDLRLSALKRVAREHVRYPRYIMPNEVIDNLSNQVPVLFIGTYLSLSTAGYYGLAMMILAAPAAVLGQAVGQSFMQLISKAGDDRRGVFKAMYQIWGAMAAIGVLPFGGILLFGPELFSFAFGNNWAMAGVVAQPLAVLLFVRFVSSPTSTVYLKLGLHVEQWRFCLAAACYRTLAYSLIGFGFDLLTAFWTHVVLETFAIIAYNLVAVRRLSLPDRGVQTL